MIKALAPTRIDLAGGTLDMPPLFLFHEFGLTINIAIDLYAEVTLEEVEGEGGDFEFYSKDLDSREQYGSIEEMKNKPKGTLELLTRTVGYFEPKKALRVTTDIHLPKGSGLAGSSALMIALVGALNHHTKRGLSKPEMLTIAKSIETQLIKVPTGFQDYYPALYGSLTFLWLTVRGNKREEPSLKKEFLDELQEKLILVYTGEPHFSGTNNWQIFKDHIDGNKEVIQTMQNIRQTAEKMRKALLAEDIDRFADVLNEDWENRKRLSPGVTTDQIESLITVSKEHGARAARVCGAGGGGCMVVLAKDDPDELKEVLKKNGARILDYRFDYKGLTIEEI
ncbi:GHMP kinase [Patescibacteria group bacterium]|nr:GHMP kinase [Patescibacteria group bacterium]